MGGRLRKSALLVANGEPNEALRLIGKLERAANDKGEGSGRLLPISLRLAGESVKRGGVMLDFRIRKAHPIEIVRGTLPVRTTVTLIIVIFYLVTAAVVAALDPGADLGSAIASGLLWPISALELAWEFMTSFFGPMFG